MKHIPEFIQSLVQKYLDGTATGGEKKIVDEWYESFSAAETEFDSAEDEALVSRRVKERLDQFIQKNKPVIFFKRNIFLGAAAILLLIILSGVIYYYIPSPGSKGIHEEAAVPDTITQDIAAGGKKSDTDLRRWHINYIRQYFYRFARPAGQYKSDQAQRRATAIHRKQQ